MTGLSLSEIKNKRGQLIATPKKADYPVLIDVPDKSPVVKNFDADLLDGKHLSDIMTDLNTYINTSMVQLSKNVGHIDTINGVRADGSKDITLRAMGDIKVFSNPKHNEIVISGHNAINGMSFVDFIEPFDGAKRRFSLNSRDGFIDGPELMIFYDGILMSEGKDFTFFRETSEIEFLPNIAPPEATDNVVAMITANGAKNQGFVLINYVEGAIDGFNRTFIFPTASLSSDNVLVFKNGMLMKYTNDYDVVGGNKVIFTNTVAVDSKLYFLHIRPYGGIFKPLALTGAIDGTNKKFKVDDMGYTSNTIFIWKNGTLVSRDSSAYSYDPYQGAIIFQEAPVADSYIKAFSIALESNVVSINSVLPDDFRNIQLVPGTGIKLTPDYQKHELKIELDQTTPGGSTGYSTWHTNMFTLGADPLAPLELDFVPAANSEFVVYQRYTLYKGSSLDYTLNGNQIMLNPSLGAIQGELLVVRYQTA